MLWWRRSTVQLHSKAIEVKYKKVLTLFHDCHKIYNGNAVTNEDIDNLGN